MLNFSRFNIRMLEDPIRKQKIVRNLHCATSILISLYLKYFATSPLVLPVFNNIVNQKCASSRYRNHLKPPFLFSNDQMLFLASDPLLLGFGKTFCIRLLFHQYTLTLSQSIFSTFLINHSWTRHIVLLLKDRPYRQCPMN